MKEHSFFLQTGFSYNDFNSVNQADYHRKAFDALLADTVALSDGVVSTQVLQSGEVITPFTLETEMNTSNLTGVPLAIELTQSEIRLTGDGKIGNSILEQQVNSLNNNAINLITSIVQFKSDILSNVLSCNLFPTNYSLFIDHMAREASFYLSIVQKLQNRDDIIPEKEIYEQNSFWHRIMTEHIKFTREMLEPLEFDSFIPAKNILSIMALYNDHVLRETKHNERLLNAVKLPTMPLNAP